MGSVQQQLGVVSLQPCSGSGAKARPPCPWIVSTCAMAAQYGQAHILQWLRSQCPPCQWDEWSCSIAARCGQFEVLQSLRSQCPPCAWSEYICSAAACSGQLGPCSGLGTRMLCVHGLRAHAQQQLSLVNLKPCSGSGPKNPPVPGVSPGILKSD